MTNQQPDWMQVMRADAESNPAGYSGQAIQHIDKLAAEIDTLTKLRSPVGNGAVWVSVGGEVLALQRESVALLREIRDLSKVEPRTLTLESTNEPTAMDTGSRRGCDHARTAEHLKRCVAALRTIDRLAMPEGYSARRLARAVADGVELGCDPKCSEPRLESCEASEVPKMPRPARQVIFSEAKYQTAEQVGSYRGERPLSASEMHEALREGATVVGTSPREWEHFWRTFPASKYGGRQ